MQKLWWLNIAVRISKLGEVMDISYQSIKDGINRVRKSKNFPDSKIAKDCLLTGPRAGLH